MDNYNKINKCDEDTKEQLTEALSKTTKSKSVAKSYNCCPTTHIEQSKTIDSDAYG